VLYGIGITFLKWIPYNSLLSKSRLSIFIIKSPLCFAELVGCYRVNCTGSTVKRIRAGSPYARPV